MSKVHARGSATEQTRLDRCIDLCRKWGPPLLLVALGFAAGWL